MHHDDAVELANALTSLFKLCGVTPTEPIRVEERHGYATWFEWSEDEGKLLITLG